jgi:hypothetical protein
MLTFCFAGLSVLIILGLWAWAITKSPRDNHWPLIVAALLFLFILILSVKVGW